MGFLFFVLILSVPFDLIWNALAPTYFYWLPTVYHNIPLLDCVGLFTLAGILRALFLPARPIIEKIKWGAQKGFERTEKYVNR
ncbi:MAG: hypothetical protein ACXVA9_11870 [Bdellovibrionales bacterium]